MIYSTIKAFINLNSIAQCTDPFQVTPSTGYEKSRNHSSASDTKMKMKIWNMKIALQIL